MSSLRKYIRQILLENSVDFGDLLFSDQAPAGHSEAGDEPNTVDEQQLFDALEQYMVHNRPGGLIAMQHQLERAMHDPRYSDILEYDTRRINLYRGQVVSRSQLEYLAEENLQEYIDNPGKLYHGNKDCVGMCFGYDPEQLHRRGEISSWSDDETRAQHFARWPGKRGIADPVRVVFVASAAGNRFLRLHKLYEYVGLGQYSNESESLALESVELEYLYFIGRKK